MSTIIFKIHLKKEFGGFALVSNFIAKMEAGLEMCDEEIRGISSFLDKKDEEMTSNRVVKICHENEYRFRPVLKPQNIITGSRGYGIAYCIYMEDSSIDDVVEWQYYVLLKKYYQKSVITVISNASVNTYFKVSHYLHELSLRDQEVYNSIWFLYENQIQRLQRENIDKVKDFVPLIYINNESLKQLRKPLRDVLSNQDIIEKCLTKQLKIDSINCAPYLKGCLDYFLRFSDFIDIATRDEFVKRIIGGNLLAFILFAYSFEGCLRKKNNPKLKTNISEADKFYQQISECADGCLQLIENIVMHADAGIGVMSIRFHSTRTSYLMQKYQGDIQKIPHLEICITDYSGGIKNSNIAQKFRSNIEASDIRRLFDTLCPLDFIENSMTDIRDRKKSQEAFKQYYSCSRNIGKHYGLKIFQNILKKNHGIFSFYSHASNKCILGESWNLRENLAQNKEIQCIPGTSFSILFPLEKREEQISKSQIGVDELYTPQIKWKDYIQNYEKQTLEIEQPENINCSQDEKEETIQYLYRKFKQNIHSEKKTVFYISSANFTSDYAEYLCKAMLLVGYEDRTPDFVLYQCDNTFIKLFLQTIMVYFEMGTLDYAFQKNSFWIALFNAGEFKEMVLFPRSLEQTITANKCLGISGNELFENKWILHKYPNIFKDDSETMLEIPPYDVMHKVKIGGYSQTIFEAYALKVLETNIQEQRLGCKIVDTHMRLGSTIHIDSFYEAELLYSNQLFVSRFAYLLAEAICKNKEFQACPDITLYSYALYSELLVVKVKSILEEMFSEKTIDYAILEREAEHRGFNHVDRIRYSKFFDTNEERMKYFSNRKIICIVPINSTLKTYEKLNDMFCRENKYCTSENIIMNFAVILVGSRKENKYWTLDEEKKVFETVKSNIKPSPIYFVVVKVSYQEATQCEICFPPENGLIEKPLIEANVVSTIPDQAFGLYQKPDMNAMLSWEMIKKEEEYLSVLKKSLIYSHIKRGENHYSMYFRTDRFFIENKIQIVSWMRGLKTKLKIDFREHHILICPSHFSNTGFLEYINKIIFNDTGLIIRMDVDKEYRCNMEAKYSFLQKFIEMLDKRNERSVVHVYYIDDCIISGRTFQRAKSLVSSVLGVYTNKYTQLDIRLFDRIFVLIDRNSTHTRMQYLENGNTKNNLLNESQKRFYAFRTLHISSIRNHGDSCIICQLAKKD